MRRPHLVKSFFGSANLPRRSPTNGRRDATSNHPSFLRKVLIFAGVRTYPLRRPTGGLSWRPSLYFTTADSPCFHSHSRGICRHPRGRLAFLILETGAAISVSNSHVCLQQRWFCRDLAVTRTRRFATNSIPLRGCALGRSLPGVAIAQWLVHFPAHPQAMQQNS